MKEGGWTAAETEETPEVNEEGSMEVRTGVVTEGMRVEGEAKVQMVGMTVVDGLEVTQEEM